MKPWLYSLSISLLICLSGLTYFVLVVAPDKCLDAGGRWLGAGDGCEGVLGYELANLASPFGVIIFLGIVVAIASLLFQVKTLLLGKRK